MEPQKKPEKRKTYRERVLSGEKKPWGSRNKPPDRSGSTLKKTRLSHTSKKQKARMGEYRALLEEFWKKPENQKCRRCGARGPLDPHHTHGRSGDNLFKIIPVCRPCHDWIHQNPNQARQDGYLFF